MKKPKLVLFYFLLICIIFGFRYSDAEKEYFEEIALKSEYIKIKNPKIVKWTQDVCVFVSGQQSDILTKELQKIIKELNLLISPIEICEVQSKEASKLHIFLGLGTEFSASIETLAKPYTQSNLGLFFIYPNAKCEISKANMYVDIFRAKSLRLQKHLLREELTQALGLLNDSMKYPESIFFKGKSFTTQYSLIDKKVIKMLYHPKVKAGMSWREVSQVLDFQD